MIVPVFIDFLTSWVKEIKCELDYINHMTLKVLRNRDFGVETLENLSLYYNQRCYEYHNVMLQNL